MRPSIPHIPKTNITIFLYFLPLSQNSNGSNIHKNGIAPIPIYSTFMLSIIASVDFETISNEYPKMYIKNENIKSENILEFGLLLTESEYTPSTKHRVPAKPESQISHNSSTQPPLSINYLY